MRDPQAAETLYLQGSDDVRAGQERCRLDIALATRMTCKPADRLRAVTVACGQCGRECPDDFGFCPACGAQLGGAAARRETRKVVTVLFCDLTGSTALGDRTDPETLRALMRRYYETARTVLERHGGTVEKFVGDAVMAVFGVPVATEDDALRGIRAAVELRETVHALSLEARIGVNTGDVVGGEGDTFVSGDAVNVAARLEQAAGAGQILLGEQTLSLVRDAVTTEPVRLTLKGKSADVTVHRLLGLDVAAAGLIRRLDRAMMGREREAQRLRAEFADAVAGGCRLFTLIGPAGVGKSRLVADFLEHARQSATIVVYEALAEANAALDRVWESAAERPPWPTSDQASG